MKLQLSLNETDLNKAFQQVREVQNSIDIIGLSPNMLQNYGYSLIEKFDIDFPNLDILADLLLTDSQLNLLEQAFEFGAEYVTLSRTSSNKFIEDAQAMADQMNRKIIVDLAAASEDSDRIETMDSCKADYVTLPVRDPLQKEALFNLGAQLCQLIPDADAITISSSHLNINVPGAPDDHQSDSPGIC